MKAVNNIYNNLINLENIFNAWAEFKQGKMNKPDVLSFERNLEDNLFSLHPELLNRTYIHGPYSTFHIHDPKSRLISKATVKDRLVHHLVFRELYRIFNPSFIYHSYSSREGKGTHLAVKDLTSCLRKVSRNYAHPCFALKCDIKKFFQSVPHQKLLEIIKRKVKDEKFLWLVREIIGSFISPVDNFTERERERVKRKFG